MLKSALNLLLWGITITIAIVTFMAVAAAYISPAKIWFLALFGLLFIYLYLIAFIWMLTLSFRHRKMMLIILIPLIAGLPAFVAHWNVTSSNKNATGENTIKVLSFNVRVFDLYNWTHNLETRSNIFNFLKKSDAGIYCFQEYYTSKLVPFNNTDSIKSLLGIAYVHTLLPIIERDSDQWGIATFSKYPILNKETVFTDKESANGCIATDLLIGKDTVRVYNIHLQSVRLAKNDYIFVSKFNNKDNTQKMKGSRQIVQRLKKAFIKRAHQVDKVTAHISACPYKVIVAGDFNDTPASYAYNQISNGLTDSFLSCGKGLSSTYAGMFPGLRIDYILHSKDIKSIDYIRPLVHLSDHYPIISTLNF